MGKKQSDPNQTLLPGVELDDQEKFGFAQPGGEKKPRKSNGKANGDDEHLPPNLAKPVKVKVPDFGNPKRPKTCLEVDFPLVPINALSALEGNAGKPIYQMSKWWARRRSCVFRAMLIAAAMEAPIRKNPDGSPVLDDQGQPIPDETEAAKAVWDLYYANHQAAENFKHLKVLDCFMGGGTTLVEGSRLGFQVSGVDLNPVAWFVVKNELACTDPDEVKRFFDQIEAEVKPVIQPFYVTDCPRGHKGKWYELADTGTPADDLLMPSDFDPVNLAPDERKKYRYEGPEIIYTFWAKHGPCSKPGCGHRTPVFRSPVIAEKVLGVKYIELKCKECKTAFDAELGDARMAPGAEHIVLPNEKPFTALSQPFAQRLLEYSNGKKEDKKARATELYGMVNSEPGLKCPKCGAFAGQYLRDVFNNHRQAATAKAIDKKHLKIEPPRNSTKSVYSYLLIHPDWLKGSPGSIDAREFGGYSDAPVDATALWYEERLKNLRFVEVRGRIKLSEDTTHLGVVDTAPIAENEPDDEQTVSDEEGLEETPAEATDRKEYGLPRYLTLADGRRLDTRRATVPEKSAFTCAACGKSNDFLTSLKTAKIPAPVATYAIHGYCPECDSQSHVYSGRFFKVVSSPEKSRLVHSEAEWSQRMTIDLAPYWPKDELPPVFMTHHNNGGIPNWGYTHFFKMFNGRQLLGLTQLLAAIVNLGRDGILRDQALGGFQQYLRNQNMFCIWNMQADKLEPFFSNSNYAPKALTVENSFFGSLGRGNWTSCTEKVVAGTTWARDPWEVASNHSGSGSRLELHDPVSAGASVFCRSASDLEAEWTEMFDLVITDPPFGNNIFYGDLANYFHVWMRAVLEQDYPEVFRHRFSPRAQECVADRSRFPGDTGADDSHPNMKPADAFYEQCLRQCWDEARRVMKPGGLMAFTFHHSLDAPWESVLRSLFDAGWILEATFPIKGDETKGEGSRPGTFGSQKTEYDMIHVCRKRLDDPTPMSWPKMRQWVKKEFRRLKALLDAYRSRELTEGDIRVILRGKALEFFSRHYGRVFTAENEQLSIRDALLGINQLLDEGTGQPGERPPTVVHPLAYHFLRLFGYHESLSRDELSKSLRGTGIVQRELEHRGWIEDRNKVVYRVPIHERFEHARKRPRKEMKAEIDQAHFLIGAAMPGSGVNLEEELGRDTWMVRRSVEAVLDWYAKTAPEPEIQKAAKLAGNLLRRSFEQNRTKLKEEQGYLFDDLSDED